MRLFQKIKHNNGQREVYIFGFRVFKYQKKCSLFDNPNKAEYLKSLGIKIGNNCRICGMPQLGSEPYLIEIGNDNVISGEVVFLTHDGGANVLIKYVEDFPNITKFGKIKVGDNCFIGYRTIILPDVTIGNNCVIGAGSVVTKNIPDGEVWAGNPARFIKKTEEYVQKVKDATNKDKQIELVKIVNKYRNSIQKGG